MGQISTQPCRKAKLASSLAVDTIATIDAEATPEFRLSRSGVSKKGDAQ
jgi:hypothetical protein